MPSSSPAFKCETLTRSKILVASCRSATNALRGMAAVKKCTGCVTSHKIWDVRNRTERWCLVEGNGPGVLSKIGVLPSKKGSVVDDDQVSRRCVSL